MLNATGYDPAQDVRRRALGLARQAARYYDEHGAGTGAQLSTWVLDYLPHAQTAQAPYFDVGGAGLGLVRVERKRIYAQNYGHGPRVVSTTCIVGRNESGTFFAHAVSPSCKTVPQAIDWIWGGRSAQLVCRQGDLGIIRGRGPQLPTAPLPRGHRVVGDQILHATHPPLPLPGRGERVIIARRAFARVSEETRD